MPFMSHRERVVTALSHRQPDRVPIDLGTTVVTGIALKTYERLKARLGLDLGETQVYDRRNQLAIVDDAVLDHLRHRHAQPAGRRTRKPPDHRVHGPRRLHG